MFVICLARLNDRTFTIIQPQFTPDTIIFGTRHLFLGLVSSRRYSYPMAR
jgi:hypothetical protein